MQDMRASMLLVALALCLLAGTALADSNQFKRMLRSNGGQCDSGSYKHKSCQKAKDGLWSCDNQQISFKDCHWFDSWKGFCCHIWSPKPSGGGAGRRLQANGCDPKWKKEMGCVYWDRYHKWMCGNGPYDECRSKGSFQCCRDK